MHIKGGEQKKEKTKSTRRKMKGISRNNNMDEGSEKSGKLSLNINERRRRRCV